jgi:hypothetical protein
MSTYDFSNEERWDPTSALLIDVGNWVATIKEADTGKSSGGYPQIELRVVKGDSSLRAWVVITPASLGKVVQLTDAAGLPNPGSVDVESDEFKAYVKQLEGKQVGIIVRDVPRNDDPSRLKRSIEAFCTPAEVPQADADVPADTSGLVGSGTAKQDDDIPF